MHSLLFLLAAIAFIPNLIAITYSTLDIQQQELINEKRELESFANLAVANQRQIIEGERQMLATIASGPSLRRTDLELLCTEFLLNVIKSAPSNIAIGLIDLDGKTVCGSSNELKATDLASQEFFSKTIEARKFVASGLMVNSASGKRSIGLGMPVDDYDGKLRGVAFALLDPDYISRQLQSVNLPEALEIKIYDASGKIIASTRKEDSGVGLQTSDKELTKAIESRREGTYTTTDHEGAKQLRALKIIDGGGDSAFFVTASIKEKDLRSINITHFRSQLILMTAASMLGIFFSWMFARRIFTKPIEQLLGRMRSVEQGLDLDAKTSTSGTNLEFSELNDGFSAMLSKLSQNQQQLLRAQEITRVGFYQLDLRSHLYSASPIVYEILGLDPDIGPVTIETYQSMIHPHDQELVRKHREMLLNGGKPMRLQYRIVRPDGTLRWIDGYGFLHKNEQGELISYSGAIQDITDRKLAEQETRTIENRFRLLFENSIDGVLQTAPDGTVLMANPAACRIFGLTEAELIARGRNGVVFEGDSRLQALLEERARKGQARGVLTMIRGDGSHFETEFTSSVYEDETGNPISSIILRDITERIKTEQHIHFLAYFDGLTQLPNRRLLIDRLTLLHAVAQRNNQFGAVLFIDLDHFKTVNDARGHATGDALLQQVAQRLSSIMREEDTIGRIGGDEFVVLAPNLSSHLHLAAEYAMTVAEKLREALNHPFQINDKTYSVAASIGVTLMPKPGQTAEDLLREADTAMYRAKNTGKNRVAFFERIMQSRVEERLSLENDLANALGTKQLEMHLQPQFDRYGATPGCELLIRWMHPERDCIPPTTFIPIAEETGLICRLGDWVLREGCKTLVALQEADEPMTVSINVSPRQFKEANFVDKVRQVLAETHAPASNLIFEITEGLLIDSLESTIVRMKELAELGIRFSVDDFGTGYSSLSYLRHLPLHELKIDQTFIRSIPQESGGTAIVQSIISLAKNLNLKVVAEGVETQEQLEFLKEAGCDLLQGYLLSRPMPIKTWMEGTAQRLP